MKGQGSIEEPIVSPEQLKLKKVKTKDPDLNIIVNDRQDSEKRNPKHSSTISVKQLKDKSPTNEEI